MLCEPFVVVVESILSAGVLNAPAGYQVAGTQKPTLDTSGKAMITLDTSDKAAALTALCQLLPVQTAVPKRPS